MVDITDLKSVGPRPWEFKSPRPHQFLDNKYGKICHAAPARIAGQKDGDLWLAQMTNPMKPDKL